MLNKFPPRSPEKPIKLDEAKTKNLENPKTKKSDQVLSGMSQDTDKDEEENHAGNMPTSPSLKPTKGEIVNSSTDKHSTNTKISTNLIMTPWPSFNEETPDNDTLIRQPSPSKEQITFPDKEETANDENIDPSITTEYILMPVSSEQHTSSPETEETNNDENIDPSITSEYTLMSVSSEQHTSSPETEETAKPIKERIISPAEEPTSSLEKEPTSTTVEEPKPSGDAISTREPSNPREYTLIKEPIGLVERTNLENSKPPRNQAQARTINTKKESLRPPKVPNTSRRSPPKCKSPASPPRTMTESSSCPCLRHPTPCPEPQGPRNPYEYSAPLRTPYQFNFKNESSAKRKPSQSQGFRSDIKEHHDKDGSTFVIRMTFQPESYHPSLFLRKYDQCR